MGSTKAGRREISCAALSNWLNSQILGLWSQLTSAGGQNGSSGDLEPIPAMLLEELYTAALEVDFATVARICTQFPSVAVQEAAVQHLVARIESGWQTDDLGVIQASDAFWTIKRAMAFLKAKVADPDDPRVRSDASAIVYVPVDEDHTFGAQLLYDRMRERRINAHLKLQEKKTKLYDALEAERVDFLAISLGYDRSLLTLPDLIQEARIVSSNPKMIIALGGQVFSEPPSSYAFLGADIISQSSSDPVDELIAVFDRRRAERGLLA